MKLSINSHDAQNESKTRTKDERIGKKKQMKIHFN